MTERKHLGRLERLWGDSPIFFITTCTARRRRDLANEELHRISREVWQNTELAYNWLTGFYVLMPDHAHFFCAPKSSVSKLEAFVGKWKEWTAKYAHRRLAMAMPFWQDEFFDHVLRSHESYEEKWNYVRQNPVRAGLVRKAEDWPYQGVIHDLRFD